MITNDPITTLAAGAAVLTTLRALSGQLPGSVSDMRDVADRQAALLKALLPGSPRRIIASLTTLIPSILIEFVDHLPVPGTSFWANGRWHIQLRTGDPTDFQSFTALHQLKHIIDHPLRRTATQFSATEWEAVADRFAGRVLAQTPSRARRGGMQ